jgi:fatty-acyl-CoA synthase
MNRCSAIWRLDRPAPAEAELAGYCRARLAAYKTPTRWLFTDAFPLTSTGKIRKDVLSAQLGSTHERV